MPVKDIWQRYCPFWKETKFMSKRIETKVSITAQGTCLMRAISYYEQDKYYKSDDYIAPLIIPQFLNFLAKYTISRTVLKKRFFKNPGLYEYIISRTKFIDNVFKNLAANIEQVLIFGAGFDSRAIRFKDELKNAKVFELDAPVTQQAKIHRLKGKNIEIPGNLKFISLDFTKESLSQKLDEAGFQKHRTCLFVLEGLTYYLNQESIDSTLSLISDYSAKDSLLVFDYASALAIRQEHIHDDPKIKEHYQFLAKAGEKPGFTLEGPIQDFLAKYNFQLIDELDSTKLAEMYFNKEELGLITKKFRIVKAKNV
ncbi:SAM-dependent methyltransferase [Sporomusa sp.]|uniref:class I SAM-dependent methyltransferase n=1 Tax=Sporomusa sp. TaxID=2078658 RepID=UPI002B828039|nr:SAM-dependent methyltransferase [Sporomusa sp.]HWR44864.1 SAM-dependent methyltransferase [Sporomusa sp.]